MQLSLHADYSLRVLIYLGTHSERLVSTQEISQAYGISRHHLVRVMQTLAEGGYIEIHAGRSGGVRLAREPGAIRLGDVVRNSEPSMKLVECFDRDTNTCILSPVCALKGVLQEALDRFLAEMNRHTLADVVQNSGEQKLQSVFANFVGWKA
jgi:Rrf2 family transcriptional regulator, nitric oxide-sensitive transcriptional repressor